MAELALKFGKLSISGRNQYENKQAISRRIRKWRSNLKKGKKTAPPKTENLNSRHVPLKDYKVPELVKSWFEDGQLIESRLNMSGPLTPDNYVRQFQVFLWILEYHEAVEMHRYDLDNVAIERSKYGYEVKVHDFAGERAPPSVGDQLLAVKTPVSSVPRIYVGAICRVSANSIAFKMAPSFDHDERYRFDVTFQKLRTANRRCHNAVRNCKNIPEVLFPEAADPKDPKIQPREPDPERLICLNDRLNQFQRQAVYQVLSARSRPAPYIIYGPPGTGKTVTLMECILQVYTRKPHYKILVCANSNYCTNMIAKKLKDRKIIPKRMLCRISAFYDRGEDCGGIQSLMRTTNSLSDEEYSDFRIIITTCMQAGVLLEFDDRFDYVFIDEAGHASEPEALIPMQLVKPDGCVILAGDPKQLGPVCMNTTAAKLGFNMSLLERLSLLEPYTRRTDGTYDKDYVTKLMISYRTDPRVMELNNKLFYDGDLKFENKTPEEWMTGLAVKLPIVFHPVKGENRREPSNPSWYNLDEVKVCVDYVRKLYKLGLQPDQLGIIAPYVNQIHKLQQVCEMVQSKPCKIASMERFQGDEREIIIISTVRTHQKYGRRPNLRFICDQKRFNVGISRAKWMLIIVGDPRVLMSDSMWAQLIKRAHVVKAT